MPDKQWSVRDPNTGRFTSVDSIRKQAVDDYLNTSSEPLTDELGVVGHRRQYGGMIYNDFIPELQGQRAVEVFREMRNNDAVIVGILYAIETLLRELDWDLSLGGSEEDDFVKRDFVQSCLDDLAHTWDDHLSEVCDTLVYGFSWFNTVYKQRRGDTGDQPSMFDDGLYGWERFSYRDPSTLARWEMNDHNRVQAFVQQTGGQTTIIPLQRSIFYRTTTTKPEGRSMLRGAYRAWWLKANTEDVTAVGIERDLVGMPIAYVPAEILKEKGSTYTTIRDIVQRVRRHEQEGVIFPGDRDETGARLYEFDTIQSAGAPKVDPLAFISLQAGDIAATVLADFMRLGRDAVGSRALADPKVDVFRQAMDAFADTIAATFNRQAIAPLMRINGFQPPYPSLSHSAAIDLGLDAVADFVEKTGRAGMPWFGMPGDTVEDRLRQMAGFDPAPDEQDMLIE